MKQRKLLSGLLILCMILTLLPISVCADDTFPDPELFGEKKAADSEKIYLEATLDSENLYDPGDNYFFETEPNNTIYEAGEIYHDYTIEGVLSGDDLDGYIFNVNDDSRVTVISISSSDGLEYVIYENTTGEILAMCEYLGYNAENGVHEDALVCDLPAGSYSVLFADYYENYLQYMFYLDIHTHNYYAEVVKPGCDTEGYTIYTCSSCDSNYVSDYTDPAGCAWDNGTVLTKPTSSQAGTIEYRCTRCGNTIQLQLHHRIAGSGRCETAIAAANELKSALGISKFNTIILASGDNFADALAGSYLAAVKKAPILLYRASAVSLNQEYIEKNLSSGGIVYLLGGTSAIPAKVETDLRAAGITVQRLAGDNRFDTNLEILKAAGVSNGQEILVATGHNFADSLSASATGLPILLVNNTTGTLTANQKKFLASIDGASLTIIGGTSAVSNQLADALSNYATVSRLSGSTRYETSIKVAQRYFTSPDSVVMAYARNFPDGLCGGPLAYAYDAPLILTDNNHYDTIRDYVEENNLRTGHILGGTSLISDMTAHEIFYTAY